MFLILTYLSPVMMLSASSSISFSAATMSFSTCCIFSLIPSFSIIFSSRSKILIANQRCFSLGIWCKHSSSICAIACSTIPLKICSGSFALVDAASIAAFTSLSIPSFLSADISTTGQPSASESFSISILSPFFRTTSIMLIAITTGNPISRS